MGSGEAVGSAVALLFSTCALEPGIPAKAKGFLLGCPCAREEGFPSLRRERGAAGGGEGEQMEGLEEHRVAAVSLGRGDPDWRLCEEERGGWKELG